MTAFRLVHLAIRHFRVDSVETQHAHVVGALADGQLQYRDFFANHMPLFQTLCASWFRLLGQRSCINLQLRFAMLDAHSISERSSAMFSTSSSISLPFGVSSTFGILRKRGWVMM